MKDTSSPMAKVYFSEVLGVKNYLCPESIYSLRSLEGGVPCRVLIVVFKALSSSQKLLLKKIMASLDIFEFSVLEVKDNEVLNQLLSCKENLADFVCFFGGKNLLKEGYLIKQKDLFISSRQQNSSKQKPVSFLQVCSLDRLEGNSSEIRDKKKQVWEQLKKWKRVSKI